MSLWRFLKSSNPGAALSAGIKYAVILAGRVSKHPGLWTLQAGVRNYIMQLELKRQKDDNHGH